MNPVLEARMLTKKFRAGSEMLLAVNSVTLEVNQGQFIAIMGPSGSGKSTLLHLLSGLEKATSGGVTICGVNLSQCNDEELTRVRREKVGFVFQFFNLISVLSAYENITLPLLMAGNKESAIRERAIFLLEQMGLRIHMDKRPYELSGGQQQRVAIARALLPNPPIIMADEPTGSLDTTTGSEVLKLLRDACRAPLQRSVVMVTHDPKVASFANRVLFMRDGEIVGDVSEMEQPHQHASSFLTAIQQYWEMLMA